MKLTIFGIEYKKPSNNILNHKLFYSKISLMSRMLISNHEFAIIDVDLLKTLYEKRRIS